jgi:hypothetical protein
LRELQRYEHGLPNGLCRTPLFPVGQQQQQQQQGDRHWIHVKPNVRSYPPSWDALARNGKVECLYRRSTVARIDAYYETTITMQTQRD